MSGQKKDFATAELSKALVYVLSSKKVCEFKSQSSLRKLANNITVLAQKKVAAQIIGKISENPKQNKKNIFYNFKTSYLQCNLQNPPYWKDK